ncbi:MAG TPA: NAD-dependent epimerase/dehydratase family protein, partial [Chthonomonadales bacterium]|nr:NAD-dependent epimerase/dehydratase family protein [Chthonomonadales bacterium]
MNRVLVTGGAGFIGSHLVETLMMRGAKVRVLDNLRTGTLANLAGARTPPQILKGDIRSAATCLAACDGIETLFHLAAFVSVPQSVTRPGP